MRRNSLLEAITRCSYFFVFSAPSLTNARVRIECKTLNLIIMCVCVCVHANKGSTHLKRKYLRRQTHFSNILRHQWWASHPLCIIQLHFTSHLIRRWKFSQTFTTTEKECFQTMCEKEWFQTFPYIKPSHDKKGWKRIVRATFRTCSSSETMRRSLSLYDATKIVCYFSFGYVVVVNCLSCFSL